MNTSTPRTARRLGKLAVAVVMGAGLVGALAPAALAQDTSNDNNSNQPAATGRPHPQLTDAQQACLQQHGVQKPAPGTEPTDAQRQAFRQAAQACGISLPRHRHPRLTDAQKTCLQRHGVQKPADGQRPTDAQRQAFRAAAKACGIQLPQRPNGNGNNNSESTNSKSPNSQGNGNTNA
jgi:hypothetical protein